MRIWKEYPGKVFLKTILILLSGSFLAQLLGMISYLFIARIYSPDAMGVFSIFMTILAWVTPVLNARFDFAIVSESCEDNVFPLMKLCIMAMIVVSLATTLMYALYIIFFVDAILNKLTILVLFISLIASGLVNILNSYNNRMGSYKILNIANVKRSLVQSFLGIFIGMLYPLAESLIISYCVSCCVAINTQLRETKDYLLKISQTKFDAVRKVFEKHKKQLTQSAPAQLINSSSYAIIAFFIQDLFGLSHTGYYYMATRVLGLPLSLISSNVAKVYFKDAVEEHNRVGTYIGTTKKTITLLVMFSLPIFILLHTYILEICQIALGSQWVVAGEYMLILTPMFAIRFVVTTITPAFVVSNRQEQELIFQAGFIFVSLIVFVYAKLYAIQIKFFLFIIGIGYSIVYLLGLFRIISLAKISK